MSRFAMGYCGAVGSAIGIAVSLFSYELSLFSLKYSYQMKVASYKYFKLSMI